MAKHNKLNPNQIFLGIFMVQNDGKLKLTKARQLTSVNQFKAKWLQINARQLARNINKSELVIK